MKTFNEELDIHIKAKIPVITVTTYEWQRLYGFCVKAGKQNNRDLYRWSIIGGLSKWDYDNKNFQKNDDDINDPLELIEWFIDDEQKDLLLILEDFHPFLNDQNFQVIRSIREACRIKASTNKTLIIQEPFHINVPELTKEVPILELELPKENVLKTILESCIDDLDFDSKPKSDEEINELVIASLGMSSVEAEYTFNKIIAEKERLTLGELSLIVAEKEQIIKKEGILEYFHPSGNFNQIGGLNNLKEWLESRGKAFSKDAKDYGLSSPKGVMLLGVPGCGKSLVSKTIANEWNLPLLKFDLGKVFGGIVGESESNIRKALSLAETIAPSILWIDEIEKGLSGIGSSGDSGTSSRVFGNLLTWMQDKKSEVFVIATANNIEQLPPELLRKGRFDEIFFVDIPSEKEREKIFEIHIKNKKRNIDDYDIKTLVKKSKGFSGAEIEEAINEGLYMSYSDITSEEMETKHIVEALEKTYPLSKTMAQTINSLRKWAKTRARLASTEAVEIVEEDKNKAPVLKQEKHNPFVDGD